MHKLLLGVSLFAVIASAKAQQDSLTTQLETVHITDTRFKLEKSESGKPVIVITEDDLAARPGDDLAQVLNDYAGIEINGARSNAGQNLSYFIRGGRNRQVTVLIDGVQVSDPSQIASDFNLQLVNTQDVERIEVLKGASSVLYGSGASSAVISITTKKTARKTVAARVYAYIGSDNSEAAQDYDLASFRSGARVSGTLQGDEGFTYAVGVNQEYTDGLSAVQPLDGSEGESDTFNQLNAHAQVGFKNLHGVKWTSRFDYDRINAAFDNFDYTDADNENRTEQLRFSNQLGYDYGKGSIELRNNNTWTDREIVSSFPSLFDARSITADLYNKHDWGRLQTVVGVNAQFNAFESQNVPFGSTDFATAISEDDADITILDPYVNLLYKTNFGLNLAAGARYNTHSLYDGELVYSINPSYRTDLGSGSAKVFASYATAYIAPSLFQLYDPSFGNENLVPEENTTIEVGVGYETADFGIQVTAYQRDENQFVDFVNVDPVNFIFQYQNVDAETQAQGIEVEGRYSIMDNLRLTANYTFTERDTEALQLRIPRHKVNASLSWTVNDRNTIMASYNLIGSRDDAFFDPMTFASTPVELESFTLVDLRYTHKVPSKGLTLFAGITNLLNEEYQELFGFQTQGRNARIGFSLEL